jgi:hypothetical protein
VILERMEVRMIEEGNGSRRKGGICRGEGVFKGFIKK